MYKRFILIAAPLMLGAITAAFVFVFPPAPSTHAAGTTYYVATNGSDSNPGTQVAPFRTINKGVSILTPGDTLYIRAGTYAESISPGMPSGTSWSNPITVAGYPGETVTITPGGSKAIDFYTVDTHYVIFDHLVLDGTGTAPALFSISGPAHHIRLSNSEVKNAAGDGLEAWYQNSLNASSDYNKFLNLDVHDNGLSGSGHGFYLSTSNNLVKGCKFHDHNKYAIQIYSGWPGQRMNNNVIDGNIFYRNGVANTGATLILSTGDNNQAINNIMYSNYKEGISTQYNGPTNSKILNNTIYSNGTYGIQIGSDSQNALVENNIIYANPSGGIVDYGSSGTTYSNNLCGTAGLGCSVVGDPKFMNATAHDFHLQSTSPAINAGTTLSQVPTDFDGVSRPQGSAYDIGAYEFSSGGTPTPTPTPSPSGPISVDSSFSGYTTAPLDDGIVNTTTGDVGAAWASADTSTDHWIEITFPSSRSLSSATLSWAWGDGEQRFMTSQSVQVQYWNGSSYQTTATMTRTSDIPSTTVSFPAVNTTKLRFYQPSGQGNPIRPNLMWITEVDYDNTSTPTPCSLYTPTSPIPTGFGSPYDVVSAPATNLIQATCDTSSATISLGKGDPLQYIYNTGYLYKLNATNWTPISYTSTQPLVSNAWYPKTATELSNTSYILGYLCTWTGSQWKCGCRDSACTQSYWQIQSFKR